MSNISSSNGLEKRPKLRFPGFDEPWENQKFSSVFSFLQNNTLSRSELDTAGDALNIHYGDVLIKYGSVLDVSGQKIPYIVPGNESPNYVHLQDGDIVIADTAEDETVGKTTEIYNVLGSKIEAGLHTIPCRPMIPFAPKYLGYYMNTPYYHKQLIPLMQGIKVLSVSKGNISNTEISAPKFLEEQKKISSLLFLLDQRAAIQSKIIKALKKYKRGLLFREFELTTHDISYIKYIGKLHDFFNLSSGSTPSSTNKAFYSGSIRWVSSGELKPKYLCETNQHISTDAVSSCNLREYPASTLLIAMYGLEATGVRGTASILSVPATISQACMAIQQIGEIDIEYLYYWYIYNGQWIGIRIAQGTKQQNLSTDTLGKLKIYAPSHSKQKEVCKFLSQIDNLIEKESQKIDLLSSAKKGLLQQLFI